MTAAAVVCDLAINDDVRARVDGGVGADLDGGLRAGLGVQDNNVDWFGVDGTVGNNARIGAGSVAASLAAS